MWGEGLYKNGGYVGFCPCLSVSPGDDVSIKHTTSQLMFYKNKQLHYTWDVETPSPVWGYVGLFDVNQISIKGEKFDFYSIFYLCLDPRTYTITMLLEQTHITRY